MTFVNLKGLPGRPVRSGANHAVLFIATIFGHGTLTSVAVNRQTASRQTAVHQAPRFVQTNGRVVVVSVRATTLVGRIDKKVLRDGNPVAVTTGKTLVPVG